MLETNEFAYSLALEHSEKMASGERDFGHDEFDDRSDRIIQETGATSVGENVASGQKSAQEVMTSWLDSQGHRENIEGDFTHIAVGIAASANGTLYFTQIFLKI